jgi:hypothetical protein
MAGYIGNIPTPQATQSRQSFTATASQTTFATVGYTPNFLDVYLNGVHLLDGTDYTATNGSDVVLTVGAAVSDVVEVISYETFAVLDQTFTGTTTTDVLTTTGAFTSLGIDDNATSTAMTLDGSGKVGIGTDSPSETLHIRNTSGGENGAILIESFAPNIKFNDLSSPVPDYQILVNSSFEIKRDSAGDGTFESTDLTIDSSGNVGIGTSSPSETLVLNKASLNNVLAFQLAGSSKAFMGVSSLTNGILAGSSANDLNIRSESAINFGSSGSSNIDMRIDSSGNLLVGTTTAPTGAANGAQIGASGEIKTSRETTASTFQMRFHNPNGVVGGVVTGGSSTSYNTSSDYRLKENITPVQGAADIVKAMRPVTYNFKADSTDWHDGFLAHELQELHPRAVIGSKDAMQDEEYEVTPAVLDEEGAVVTEAVMGTRSVPDYQGVDYSKLTPILTAALQEALNKIDALEARLTALEAV